jgi:hypothetical protein
MICKLKRKEIFHLSEMYLEKNPKKPDLISLVEIAPEIFVNFLRDEKETFYIDLGLGFFFELNHKDIIEKLPDVISFNREKLKKKEEELKELFEYQNKVNKAFLSTDSDFSFFYL